MSTISDKTLNLSLSELNKLSSSSQAYEQMLKEMASYYEKLAKSSEAQAQLLGLEYLRKLDEFETFKVANKISAASESMRNILKIIGFGIACIAVFAAFSFLAYEFFGRFKKSFLGILQKWRIKKLQKDLIVISKVFNRDDDYKEEITHELTIPVSNGSIFNDIRLNFTCFRNQEFSNLYTPACEKAKEMFARNGEGLIASLEGNQGYLITSVGAPGLGKSHLTKQLCEYFAGKKDKSGCAYLELSIGQFVPSEKGLTRDDIENKFRTNMAAIFETIKSLKEKLNETKTPLVITITELDKFLGSENLMKIPRGTFVDIFFNNFINHITADSNNISDKEIFQNTFLTIDSNVKLENTSYFSEEYLKKYYDLQISNLERNKEANSNLNDILNFAKNLQKGEFNVDLGQKKGEINQKIKALEQEKANELQQLKTALGMFKSRARGFDFEFERLNKENFISALIDINDHDYDINYDNINEIMDRKNGDNYLNSELSEDEKQKIKTYFLNGRDYDSLTTDEKNKIDHQLDSFERVFNKLVNEEEKDINKEKFARIFLRSLLKFNLEEKIPEKINSEKDFEKFGQKSLINKIQEHLTKLNTENKEKIQEINNNNGIILKIINALSGDNISPIHFFDRSKFNDINIINDIDIINKIAKQDDLQKVQKEEQDLKSDLENEQNNLTNLNDSIDKLKNELKSIDDTIRGLSYASIRGNFLGKVGNSIANFVNLANFGNHFNLDMQVGGQGQSLSDLLSNGMNLLNQNEQVNNEELKKQIKDFEEQKKRLDSEIKSKEKLILRKQEQIEDIQKEINNLERVLEYVKDKGSFVKFLESKYKDELKKLYEKAQDIFEKISSSIDQNVTELLNDSFFTEDSKGAFIKSLKEESILYNDVNGIKFNYHLNDNIKKYNFIFDPDKIDKKGFFSIREAQLLFSLVSSFFTKKPKKEVKTRRPSLFWSIAFKGTILLLGLLNISSIFLFDEKILNTVKSIVDLLLRFVDKQNLFQYSHFFEIGLIVLFAIILLKIEMMIAEYIYSQDNQTSMMKDFRSFISEARKSLFKNTAEVFKEHNSIPNRVLFVTVPLGFLAADIAIILNFHKISQIFDVCTEKFLNLVNKPNLFQHFDKFNIGFICLAALFVLLIEAAITYRLSENVELNAKFFEYESAANAVSQVHQI